MPMQADNMGLLLVTMLQMDKTVETALPERLESMKRGNYSNIELPDRMEQKKGWKALEQEEMWRLVL